MGRAASSSNNLERARDAHIILEAFQEPMSKKSFFLFFSSRVSEHIPMLSVPGSELRQPMLLVDQLLAEPKLQSRVLARREHG